MNKNEYLKLPMKPFQTPQFTREIVLGVTQLFISNIL